MRQPGNSHFDAGESTSIGCITAAVVGSGNPPTASPCPRSEHHVPLPSAARRARREEGEEDKKTQDIVFHSSKRTKLSQMLTHRQLFVRCGGNAAKAGAIPQRGRDEAHAAGLLPILLPARGRKDVPARA